jgi:hypothetical protein
MYKSVVEQTYFLYFIMLDHHALDNLKALNSKICRSIVVAPSILKFADFSVLRIDKS